MHNVLRWQSLHHQLLLTAERAVPTKTLRMLEFLSTPRTWRDIEDKFGKCRGIAENLVASGAVRFFVGANERSDGRYQRFLVRHYVATGKPYVPPSNKERGLRYPPSDAARQRRNEHKRKMRALKKAESATA
jgi:hypothetical protein